MLPAFEAAMFWTNRRERRVLGPRTDVVGLEALVLKARRVKGLKRADMMGTWYNIYAQTRILYFPKWPWRFLFRDLYFTVR